MGRKSLKIRELGKFLNIVINDQFRHLPNTEVGTFKCLLQHEEVSLYWLTRASDQYLFLKPCSVASRWQLKISHAGRIYCLELGCSNFFLQYDQDQIHEKKDCLKSDITMFIGITRSLSNLPESKTFSEVTKCCRQKQFSIMGNTVILSTSSQRRAHDFRGGINLSQKPPNKGA